jgi:hypothetical protein
MTETIEIPAHEYGMVRVFDGRFPSEATMRAYAVPEGVEAGAHWPMRGEMGVERLESRGVEAFPMANLKGMGLPSYLQMAYGVSEADAADPQLAEARGHVILVASRAFGGEAARMRVPERLRHLGTFRDAEARAAPRPAPALGGGGTPEPITAGGAGPAGERVAGRGTGRRIAGAGAIAAGALLVAGKILASEWLLWVPGLALALGGAFVARGRAG